jgi:hypothetical protein
MLRWLKWRLHALDVNEIYDALHQPLYTPAERLKAAIAYAEQGDVDLLRQELIKITGDPKVGRFVNLPKLRKGERWRTSDGPSWIAKAAADVPRIRKLWAEHYNKKRRRRSDGWSAERFAGEIWTVDVEQIERHLKKH